jgi:hypothetical protein
VGSEVVVSDRRAGAVGHGFVAAFTAGAGTGSSPRPVGWTSIAGGWQGDRGRVRFRAGLGGSATWAPPAFPGERAPYADAPDAQVGWWWLAAGPDLTAGVVLGRGWTLTGTARPHVAALDVDRDGRADLVPWTMGGLGLEIDR